MKKTLMLTFLCFFISGCGPENLQRINPLDPNYSSEGSGVVSGRVMLGGIGLSNATVALTPSFSGSIVQTNGTGDFSIRGVPAGRDYTLAASASFLRQTGGAVVITKLSSGEQRSGYAVAMNENPVLFEDFNGYTGAPATPTWQPGYVGPFNVNSGVGVSGSNGCQISTGSGQNYFLDSKLISTGSGIKTKVAMQISGQDSSCFLKLTDTAGTGVIELGFYNPGGSWGVYRRTPASPTYAICTSALTASTYYSFTIVADNDANTVEFSIDNYSGSSVWKSSPQPIWNTSAHNSFNKVSIVLYNTSGVFACYFDEVKALAK